jgi:hypothetical protein
MSERPLFPNGALARNPAMFQDASGANSFRDLPTDAASPNAAPVDAVPLNAAPLNAGPVDAVPATSGAGVIAAAPLDDNIFASPQANAAGPAVRAYHAGDFVATESDSAATLLVAGKVALALGAFGAVMLMSVFFKWVIWPFALLAALLFMASGAIAFTTLLRGWQEAGLRRIGVMRASSSGVGTRVVVYSALAGAVALFGLAATTLFWFL